MHKNILLIVGASSDIGCALIRRVAAPDTLILAHYHSNRASLDALTGLPGELLPLQADLGDPAQVDALLAEVAAHGVPQQLVLLAAPRLTMQRFKDLDWSDFQHHNDMQLRSTVQLCTRLLPQMAKAKNGQVVFALSSVTLGLPPASMAPYVTAKYAMLGLMKALAAEYLGKLRINAVSPSMVDTKFLADLPDKIAEFSADAHPLKRNATVDEVAPAIAFLLSDGASYMTGVNLPIAGGAQI